MASAADETRERLREEIERLDALLRRNPYWAAWCDLDRRIGEGRSPPAEAVGRLVADYVEHLCEDPTYVAYLAARARLRALPESEQVSRQIVETTFAILDEETRELPPMAPVLTPPPLAAPPPRAAASPGRKGRREKGSAAVPDQPIRPAPPFSPEPSRQQDEQAAAKAQPLRRPVRGSSLLDRLSEIENETDALDTAREAASPPPTLSASAPSATTAVPGRPAAVPLVVEEAEVFILAEDGDDGEGDDELDRAGTAPPPAPQGLMARLDRLADGVPAAEATPRRRSATVISSEEEADLEIVVEDDPDEAVDGRDRARSSQERS